jgi:hypothetical protein
MLFKVLSLLLLSAYVIAIESDVLKLINDAKIATPKVILRYNATADNESAIWSIIRQTLNETDFSKARCYLNEKSIDNPWNNCFDTIAESIGSKLLSKFGRPWFVTAGELHNYFAAWHLGAIHDLAVVIEAANLYFATVVIY